MDYKKKQNKKKIQDFFFIFKIVFGKFSALFEKNLSILEMFCFFSVFVKFGVSCAMRRFSQNLVFEAVLFAREIKNLHKTKGRFQKCFLNIFFKKKYRSTFSQKCQFSDKKVLASTIFGQFSYIFLIRFRNHRYEGKFV